MNLLQFISFIHSGTLSRIDSVFKFKLKCISHNILQNNDAVLIMIKNQMVSLPRLKLVHQPIISFVCLFVCVFKFNTNCMFNH